MNGPRRLLSTDRWKGSSSHPFRYDYLKIWIGVLTSLHVPFTSTRYLMVLSNAEHTLITSPKLMECQNFLAPIMSLSPNERKVVRFIKSQIASIMNELAKPDGIPRITLKRRYKHSEYKLDSATSTVQACRDTAQNQDFMWSTYTWPGATMAQGWSFGVCS